MINNKFMKIIAWSIVTLMIYLVVLSTTPARAANSKYPRMAPLARYLMPDRDAEIALARSAAPDVISRAARVLVLGSHGYEIAVKGTNGFVCMVERPWVVAIDFSEVWNPHIRGADCLNPPAARSILPVELIVTQMVLEGDSQAAIVAAIRAGYHDGQFPSVEPDAMGIMMSKHSYLTDADHHNFAHLMFFTMLSNARAMGANLPHMPMGLTPYFFPDGVDRTLADGLPNMQLMVIAVNHWSDGTH